MMRRAVKSLRGEICLRQTKYLVRKFDTKTRKNIDILQNMSII